MGFTMLNEVVGYTIFSLEVIFGFGQSFPLDDTDFLVHAVFAASQIG